MYCFSSYNPTDWYLTLSVLIFLKMFILQKDKKLHCSLLQTIVNYSIFLIICPQLAAAATTASLFSISVCVCVYACMCCYSSDVVAIILCLDEPNFKIVNVGLTC